LSLLRLFIESSDGGNVEETTGFVKEKLTIPSCQGYDNTLYNFFKNDHHQFLHKPLLEVPTTLNQPLCKEKKIMECNREKNLEKCNCSYEACNKKGVCCDCIAYHLKMRQLPGCCFSKDAEATYDRSFEHFSRLVQQQKI